LAKSIHKGLPMYTFFHFLNLTLVLVIGIYAILILAHIISWLFIKEQGKVTEQTTKVSVIIPVRNEEKNIGNCLKSILAQDYPPSFIEIMVCNDHSEDNTKEEALKTIGNSGINYKWVDAGESVGKKGAIETGIKASSGELIVLTDADCTSGKSWISSIVGCYKRTNANMICGPVAITGEKNTCEKFQALELCGLSLLSGGGINMRAPLLSNAANIAYTRKAFYAVDGFKDISHTPTGDDILLMFKLHKNFPGSIHYLKSPDAIVYTHALASWKDLMAQRIRWASKGFRSGNLLNGIVSLVVFLSNFLPFICLISLFIYPQFLNFVLGGWLLKVLVDFLLLSFAAKFFGKGNLLLYYPLSSLMVMVYTSFVGIAANLTGYSWKGRNY
jgi:biofilm PGA synthesis N-glycosyltransferase PgaC